MNRTVLLATPQRTWKAWLAQHRGGQLLLCADPAETAFGHPARLSLWKGDRVLESAFLGWLNPVRASAAWVAALVELLRHVDGDTLILLPPYRANPANLELVQLALDLIQPTRIVLGDESGLEFMNWPIGPEVALLEDAHQPSLQIALRKALWLKLRQSSERHEVPLTNLHFRGARLGSGRQLSTEELSASGLDHVLRGELCGQTLFLVSEAPVDDMHIGRALDVTHATKAMVAHPAAYQDLLCALLDADGRELGMGMIDHIDFEGGVLVADVAAVAPAPVRTVKLGGTMVNRDGRESGEVKVWEL